MTNQVLETIKKRSSARAYLADEITKEELEIILRAGLEAPTATNKQEIHFSLVNGDNPVLEKLDIEKKSLRGQDIHGHNFYYEAPVLIVLSAEEGFRWSQVDSGIAVQNMTLAAESLGLGTLIIGCIYDAMYGENREYYQELLQIPAGYSFTIALAVGHKTDNKPPHEYDYARQVTIV